MVNSSALKVLVVHVPLVQHLAQSTELRQTGKKRKKTQHNTEN